MYFGCIPCEHVVCVAGVWCYSTCNRSFTSGGPLEIGVCVYWFCIVWMCWVAVSWYRWWVFQYWSTVDRSMCALALSHLNMWCVAVAWCHSTCGRSFTSGGSLNRSTCMLAQYHVNVGCCVAGVWCHSTCGRSSSSCSRGCRVPRPPSTSKVSVLSCLVCSWSDLQCWLVDHFHVGLWLFPGCQSCRLVLQCWLVEIFHVAFPWIQSCTVLWYCFVLSQCCDICSLVSQCFDSVGSVVSVVTLLVPCHHSALTLLVPCCQCCYTVGSLLSQHCDIVGSLLP